VGGSNAGGSVAQAGSGNDGGATAVGGSGNDGGATAMGGNGTDGGSPGAGGSGNESGSGPAGGAGGAGGQCNGPCGADLQPCCPDLDSVLNPDTCGVTGGTCIATSSVCGINGFCGLIATAN
jgi:hypothetical protein